MTPARAFHLAEAQVWAQTLGMAAIVIAACGLSGTTVLAAAGIVPWVEVPVTWRGEAVPYAGKLFQIGLTVLFLTLCVYLPSARRVLGLEVTHRDFAVGMDDVARAYWAAHAADREGVFRLRREFDAVRERYRFLRQHPDLQALEPEVLELAAQMSVEARDLATVYSDEKVTRAREMLAQRRQEVETLVERISSAHVVTAEIRRLLDDVEIEEDMAKAQLSRLRAELAEIMERIEGKPETPRARLRVAPSK